MKNNCGIYKIENKINGKCYIGQSINLWKRKGTHYWHLRRSSEDNRHLQSSYNKYGEDNFKFTVLLYCEPFELTRHETLLDDYYKNLGLSYNARPCADSNIGVRYSEESKKRISESNKGKIVSEETKKKIRDAIIGKPLPEGFIKNMFTKGMKGFNYGKHLSDETKRKIGDAHRGSKSAWYGKKHSEETIKKMSESAKTRWNNSEEEKIKRSDAFKGVNNPCYGKRSPFFGKHHTEEAKKKLSDAQKKFHQKLRETQEE